MSDFLASLRDDAALLSEVEDMLDGVHGAKIVLDPMPQELIQEYVRLIQTETDLEQTKIDMTRRVLQRQLEAISNEEDLLSLTYEGIVTLMQSHRFFDNVTEAENFFEKLARFEKERATFWFNVRSHIKDWSGILSVRKGWRVVRTGSKYRL